MQTKDNGTVVGLIFKAFALLAGVLAIWFFGKLLLDHAPGGMDQVPVDQVPIGIRASAVASDITAAFLFLATGLALWWMAEVVDLLSRIAANTAVERRSLSTERVSPRSEPVPQKRMEHPPQAPDDPPKYQL